LILILHGRIVEGKRSNKLLDRKGSNSLLFESIVG
jgi:hypothetical protein